jgi:carbon storage regulator
MIANFRSDGMLVFNRKVGETIVIGDITITVLQKGLNGMRLGIEAPRSVVVDRGEVDASRRQQAVIEATRQATTTATGSRPLTSGGGHFAGAWSVAVFFQGESMTRYNKLLILDDQGPDGNLRVEMRVEFNFWPGTPTAAFHETRSTTRASLTNWSCWPSKCYRLTAAWLNLLVPESSNDV